MKCVYFKNLWLIYHHEIPWNRHLLMVKPPFSNLFHQPQMVIPPIFGRRPWEIATIPIGRLGWFNPRISMFDSPSHENPNPQKSAYTGSMLDFTLCRKSQFFFRVTNPTKLLLQISKKWLPSGKHTKSELERFTMLWMGQLTISMAIFNSYVKLPGGRFPHIPPIFRAHHMNCAGVTSGQPSEGQTIFNQPPWTRDAGRAMMISTGLLHQHCPNCPICPEYRPLGSRRSEGFNRHARIHSSFSSFGSPL
jgi:hypothetical protein